MSGFNTFRNALYGEPRADLGRPRSRGAPVAAGLVAALEPGACKSRARVRARRCSRPELLRTAPRRAREGALLCSAARLRAEHSALPMLLSCTSFCLDLRLERTHGVIALSFITSYVPLGRMVAEVAVLDALSRGRWLLRRGGEVSRRPVEACVRSAKIRKADGCCLAWTRAQQQQSSRQQAEAGPTGLRRQQGRQRRGRGPPLGLLGHCEPACDGALRAGAAAGSQAAPGLAVSEPVVAAYHRLPEARKRASLGCCGCCNVVRASSGA
jgi:hypothetical protein